MVLYYQNILFRPSEAGIFFLYLKRHFGPYFGVYAMVWYLSLFFYKEKKIREINDKFVFFFQKQTKTRESKNRLIIYHP